MSVQNPHYVARFRLIDFDPLVDYFVDEQQADRIEELILRPHRPEEFLELPDLYGRLIFIRHEVIAGCQLYLEDTDLPAPDSRICEFTYHLRGITDPVVTWFNEEEEVDNLLFRISLDHEPNEYARYIDGESGINLVRLQDILLVEVPSAERQMWRDFMAKEGAGTPAATH